jgi:hypothetical protein
VAGVAGVVGFCGSEPVLADPHPHARRPVRTHARSAAPMTGTVEEFMPPNNGSIARSQ